MKTLNIITFVALTLLALLGSVAYSQNVRLVGNVPFEFNVGDVVMPAGYYDITKLNLGAGAFRIRDEDCTKATVRAVFAAERPRATEHSVLVFNRYQVSGGEENYFLSQIWVAGEHSGYQFFRGRDEKAAALRAARRDLITIVVLNANRPAE